jgi:hypothetical protein
MTIESKIFLTSLLLCILLTGFMRFNRRENIPNLMQVAVVVTFAGSVLGIIASILMMIWN